MNGKTIAIGIGAFAVGAVGGYILGQRLTINKLEKWANEEISKVRRQYRDREGEILAGPDDPEKKTGIYATPAGAAEALLGEPIDPDQHALEIVGREKVNELFVSNGYPPLEGFEPQSDADKIETIRSLETTEEVDENPLEGITAEKIQKSIWENTISTGEITIPVDAPDGEDDEDEGDTRVEFIPKRHPDRPYVIPENWYHAEDEYEKQELVYYDEDGILCDPDDRVVPNKEEIVGEQNLHKFGIGTNDRNTVYVRSERRKTDYEIIRNKGSYQEVVHGVPVQRESKAPHKMRDDGE